MTNVAIIIGPAINKYKGSIKYCHCTISKLKQLHSTDEHIVKHTECCVIITLPLFPVVADTLSQEHDSINNTNKNQI